MRTGLFTAYRGFSGVWVPVRWPDSAARLAKAAATWWAAASITLDRTRRRSTARSLVGSVIPRRQAVVSTQALPGYFGCGPPGRRQDLHARGPPAIPT
jgi:hypothetical protein